MCRARFWCLRAICLLKSVFVGLDQCRSHNILKVICSWCEFIYLAIENLRALFIWKGNLWHCFVLCIQRQCAVRVYVWVPSLCCNFPFASKTYYFEYQTFYHLLSPRLLSIRDNEAQPTNFICSSYTHSESVRQGLSFALEQLWNYKRCLAVNAGKPFPVQNNRKTDKSFYLHILFSLKLIYLVFIRQQTSQTIRFRCIVFDFMFSRKNVVKTGFCFQF